MKTIATMMALYCADKLFTILYHPTLATFLQPGFNDMAACS